MKDKDFANFCEHFIIPTDNATIASRMCWTWVGASNKKGYGKFYIEGKLVSAHRAMYEHYYNLDIKDSVLHHKCGNKSCVNPYHLQVMTESEHNKHTNTLTHCSRGHELTDENVYITTRRGRPSRQCKLCTNFTRKEKRVLEKLAESLTKEALNKLIEGGD